MLKTHNQKILLGMALFFIFILAACTNDQEAGNEPTQTDSESVAKEEAEQEQPANINYEQALWMMRGSSEGSEDVGTFYVKYGQEEPLKIADNVFDGSHVSYIDNQKALFLDWDYNLFLYEKGKENEKIGTEVGYRSYRFSEDGNSVFYLNHNYDLYVKEVGHEKAKLASSVYDYIILEQDKKVYYVDSEDNLYQSDFAGDKVKLASDATKLYLSPKNTIYFQNSEGILYEYDAKNEDKMKVTNSNVLDVMMSPKGEFMTYLTEYNFEKGYGELYLKREGEDPTRIASDIIYHDVSVDGKYVYYITYDNHKLVQYDVKSSEKTNVATGVREFIYTSNNKSVAYTSNEDAPELFMGEIGKEDASRISSDIWQYDLFDDKSVIFQNADGNVFYRPEGSENEKIASDIRGYYYLSMGKLFYLSADETIEYVSLDTKEKVTLMDDVSNYQSIYVDSYDIYRFSLELRDVIGYWYSYSDDFYMEIAQESPGSESGYLSFIDEYGTEYSNFTATTYGGTELELYFYDYDTYGWINIDGENSIMLTLSGNSESYYFTKSTEQEANVDVNSL